MSDVIRNVARNPWLWLAVGVLLIGYWFFFYIDWVDVAGPKVPNREAAADPYFAAKVFLREKGYVVETELPYDKNFEDFLTPSESVIVFERPTGEFSAPRRKIIEWWIRQGGRILYVARNDRTETFELLALHEVQLERSNNKRQKWETTGFCGSSRELNECTMDLPSRTIKTLCDRNYRLLRRTEGSDVFSSTDIEIPMERGSITFLTSLKRWQNNLIGCFDNAFYLNQLVSGADNDSSGTIYWIDKDARETVYAALWRNYNQSLLILFVLLVLWIWYRNLREVPVGLTQSPIPTAPSIINMLQSIGMFKFRNAGSDELLESLRAEILGKYEDLSNAETVDHIVLATSYSEEEIELALFYPGIQNEKRLVRAVEILQELRKLAHRD